MCDNKSGANAPFCSPASGERVAVGQVINVTWDPTYFNSSTTTTTTQIQIQADFKFAPADINNTAIKGGLDGFTSDPIDLSTGSYSWMISNEYLPAKVRSMQATLFLAQPSNNNDGAGERVTGPEVQIVAGSGGSNVNNDKNSLGSGGGRPNPIAIALPVVFGFLALVGIGGYLWYYNKRKNGGQKIFARGREGYSGRRIRGRDIKLVPGSDVRMGPVGNGGAERNVFQEEVRRQQQRQQDRMV
ncbi:hypothetical protein QBC46DRAFT_261239 [Diplogelasinospora grovesii]|uniref:Uncharacterized protein n=1 Tax=Diplogelasinospora grovesii TaxID=303347 RepID=A0AAN6N7Y4_9PEZI|nr:hypothetical protein QBC46DRAFT_261239 [Diplogelasinospora grovesii]